MSVHTPSATEPARDDATPGGPSFRPYVPDSVVLPELTLPAVVLGSILGIIFGASSLYLFLKVGMTVSASIPVAVLAITVFRGLSKVFGTRRASILENNIVQTAGSAGESIAFGVGATMPALMILGFEMDPGRVMMVSVLGGLLGILMMIPLRRAFIVKQHGLLPYPEGTACAKVLIVGEEGGANAKTVFQGFGVAFLYQVAMEAMKLWNQIPSRVIGGIASYKQAIFSVEVAPTLLGVGYIIGTRTASIMVGGGLLAALVLTPTIALFGENLATPVAPSTGVLIKDMGAKQINANYIRYIGAGAVAAGGIISLCKALPLIISSVFGGLRDVRSRDSKAGTGRTDRDLPYWVVGVGSLLLVAVIAASNLIPTNPVGRVVGAAMIVLFGFIFVTVSSRITGEMGSSSNPISGMTIATLLMTCLIFYLLKWVGIEYQLAALSVAAIVCIASSNGGTTSQDLKTGFLVGATPRAQQLAIVAGAVTSAIFIGFTLLLLNNVNTVVTSKPSELPTVRATPQELAQAPTETGPDGKTYKVWRVVDERPGAKPGKYLVDENGRARYLIDPAINGRSNLDHRDNGDAVSKFNPPQPELFAVIIKGIMSGKLPWGLVILGACLAIVLQLSGVPSLAFAVGVYLPLATTTPIFVGGLVRAIVDRVKRLPPEESDMSPAILMSSGLIAGGSLAGILIAITAAFPSVGKLLDLTARLPEGWNEGLVPPLIAFSSLVAILLWVGLKGETISPPRTPSAQR
jgi:putative OPT family oligopeptide transporter